MTLGVGAVYETEVSAEVPLGIPVRLHKVAVSRDAASAVGLYFAGPESGSFGVANRIQDVLNELEVQLL